MKLRDDSGFTLIELLTSMSIFLVIIGATLTTFSVFVDNNAEAVRADESTDRTRLAVDRMAKQLRNLANPTAAGGSSIERAGSYDFIFQTTDPIKRQVRYCLSTSPTGADDVLWFQTTGAALAPATGDCPGTGWPSQSVVARNVVNRIGDPLSDRPLFSFGCSSRTPAGGSCTSSPALYPRVLSAGVSLYLDINAADKAPAPVRMSTGVYLRNQNEPPTALIAPPSTLGSRTVLLNGSASDDPEGRTMEYQWFKGSAASLTPPLCAGGPARSVGDALTPPYIGGGVTLTYEFPSTDTTSPQPITLRVVDPGCLYATHERDVTIP